MTAVVCTSAPAKINLSLHVTGRREDGYHELDSILLPLDLADEVQIRFEPAPAATVTCCCPGRAELERDNLAARAAQAYLTNAKVAAKVEITIKKRIWVAAGLGGGSSDAAAVLRMLEEQCSALGNRELGSRGLGNRGLGNGALAALALELGADVPFFLDPTPAHVRGIGERIRPLPGVPPLDLVLANPGRPLSTAAVFAELDRGPAGTAPPAPALPPAPWSVTAAAELAHNDLGPPARRLCPSIDDVIERLAKLGARASQMSGSGATAFGVFDTPGQARVAAAELSKNTDYLVEVTRSAPSLTPARRSPI